MTPCVPVLALASAVAVGVVLGLLGAGGSILTVPILVYLAQVPPHAAIAASLVVVGLTSLVAALQHARAGHVRLRVGLTFAGAGVLGAFVGARLARGLDARVLMLLFAAVMFTTALVMLLRRERVQAHSAAPAKMLGVAAGVGLITGTVGAGGGFLIVPALLLFGGVSMSDAVGTSLMAIALNCAAGFLGKLGGAPIPWALALEFSAVAIAGSFIGHALCRRISAASLRRIFAVFILVVAAVIAANNVTP